MANETNETATNEPQAAPQPASQTNTKNVLTSKTFWLGVITALAPLIPGGADFVTQNPEAVLAAVGALIVIARLFTHQPVVKR